MEACLSEKLHHLHGRCGEACHDRGQLLGVLAGYAFQLPCEDVADRGLMLLG